MRNFILAALLCAFTLHSLAAPVTTQRVLAQMDEASGSFKGMTANIKRVTHTAVLNDTAEETGTVTMMRVNPRDTRMLIEFSHPDAKAIQFQSRKAQIYYPKMNQVEIYDLGRYSKLVDQFLLLGFGTPGRELAKSYTINAAAEETVGTTRTTKLELTPKSDEARAQLNKIELWVAQDGAYPVQQKFHQPSGDYIFITYSEVKLNPPMTLQAVDLQLPKDVRKVTPQR